MFIDVSKQPVETITVTFEGEELCIRSGLSIAAGLLEAGIIHFRNSPVTESPRSPFCMMGVCFECLVIVNGIANCQACMIEAREGMRISRQSGDGSGLTGTKAD
ncbi:MAG: (2Fe-2S)-binding protein [Rhizobiaceae bacterium]